MTETALPRLIQTYVALLLLPHNALRARLQPELAACRDAVAVVCDCEEQTVQDEYEAIVAKIRERLPGIIDDARASLSTAQHSGESK